MHTLAGNCQLVLAHFWTSKHDQKKHTPVTIRSRKNGKYLPQTEKERKRKRNPKNNNSNNNNNSSNNNNNNNKHNQRANKVCKTLQKETEKQCHFS